MNRQNRRYFLSTTVAAGAVAAVTLPRPAFPMANSEIRLGFIGCGGRGGELMKAFKGLPGAKIVGLCDPDESKLGAAKKIFPAAQTWKDLRGLIDDKGIDAVVAAPCNHWHCLSAIWAMQAGKDVYVEKPLSVCHWEGVQAIAAARKYKRICQVGTQQRSDPMQAEIKRFLHEEKVIGKIKSARVNRYGVRESIGKRDVPLKADSDVDYNLWLGPAQDLPIYREKLHYDWHWVWNTGNGEMGNWGVHVLDDLRNNVLLDAVSWPKKIVAGGGRVAWKDAGETPNVHFVYFDTGSIPVVVGLSNLREGPDGKNSPKVPGPHSGYVAYCEGGRLEGQRGRAVAYDDKGNEIKKFSGDSGRNHQQNFLDAVRARDTKMLNADVEVGHRSSGWCDLANIAVRVGSPFTGAAAQKISDPQGVWSALLEETKQHLSKHQIEIASSDIMLSPVLEFDSEKEKFLGDHSVEANRLLKREYRAPFVVPETV